MKNVSHSFNISEISIRGKPRPRTVFNEFDSFGVLLGLERLPGERNAQYKRRLLDVYTHRAGSNYIGLLNGITRELGLEWYRPIRLTLNSGLDPTFIPGIEFKEGFVRIYKNLNTKELELEVHCGDPTAPVYFINGLVDYINTNSTIYTATVLDETKLFTRSDCIINQGSSKLVLSAPLNDGHSTVLDHQNIQRGTVAFSDRETFKTEKSSEADLLKDGDFFIDYEAGVIRSYRIPDGSSTVRYRYNLTTLDPLASPVIIRSTQSDEFHTRMFNNGIPSELGAEIINELLSVVPMYWGE